MNFSFSLRDFLNDFAIGFIYVFGIILTNLEIFDWLINSIGNYTLFIFVSMYIIGLIIASFDYLINICLYRFIDDSIRKIKFKPINKIFYYIKMITLYSFFRKWTVVETFIKMQKIGKLPKEISALKTYNEFAILVDNISEKLNGFDKIFFYKSQFFQGCANSILFIFLTNKALFKDGQMSISEYIIYAIFFFGFKIVSPVLAYLYILDISRKAKSLGLV